VETDSAYAVPEALADLARQEVDVLAIMGGDGTLQHGLTEIFDSRVFGDRVPMIAPLRGGRTNMTALDLGAGRDPVQAFARLLELADRGRLEEQVRERSVLRVEFGREREVQYGMFLGVGMIHRAIELTHRLFPSGRSQGVLGSTLVTAYLIARAAFNDTQGVLSPDKVEVLLDGKSLSRGEFTLCIGSTLHRLFSGMRPFWGDEPGGLRFSFITPKPQHAIRAALPILRGRRGEAVTPENGYLSHNAHRASMRFDCGFTIDGELFEPEDGRIATVSAERGVRFLSV